VGEPRDAAVNFD